MSLKDIKESMKNNDVVFGFKQTLKFWKNKPKKGKVRVFVTRDARDGIKERLKDNGVDFEILKTKEEIAKELKIGFESEVILLKK